MILYRGFFCVSLCARVRVGALKGLKGGHIFFISFFFVYRSKAAVLKCVYYVEG